jgi:hypothetical protein
MASCADRVSGSERLHNRTAICARKGSCRDEEVNACHWGVKGTQPSIPRSAICLDAHRFATGSFVGLISEPAPQHRGFSCEPHVTRDMVHPARGPFLKLLDYVPASGSDSEPVSPPLAARLNDRGEAIGVINSPTSRSGPELCRPVPCQLEW